LLMASALVLLGVGAYAGAWNIWAANHFRQAQRAIAERDFPRARAHLRSCLEVWPGDAATHFLAARTARRAGDFTDAILQLDECDRLHGRPEDIKLEWSLLRAQQGELAPVEKDLVQQVEQGHAEAPLILEALMLGYAQTGRVPLALYCTEKWLRLEPDNVEALYRQGLFCKQLFSHQKALEDFQRVVELAPDHEQARLHLAEELLRFRRHDEAVKQFERLVADNPANAPAFLGLARCHSAMGRLEDARVVLDKLVQACPDYVPALVERGKLALDMNQAAAAEPWLREAVTAAPRGRMANYFLGQCLEKLGRQEEAQKHHLLVKQIDADWERLDEVMRKLGNAPLDPALRFEAGKLMLSVGRDEEGQRLLSALLADLPGHGPAHQVLAEYYEKNGDHARAAFHRERATQAGATDSKSFSP
jgi:tetratricopeptide (TPR) repeat protein